MQLENGNDMLGFSTVSSRLVFPAVAGFACKISPFEIRM